MRAWLDAYKPTASRRTQLLLASCTWTIVGSMLLFFGARWLLSHSWDIALLPLTMLAGVLKSRFILDRAACRIAERIRNREEPSCLGGFLSWQSWATVAVMMIAGRLLRGSHLSRTLVGLLYSAIGTGLLLSSRRLWCFWRQAGPGV